MARATAAAPARTKSRRAAAEPAAETLPAEEAPVGAEPDELLRIVEDDDPDPDRYRHTEVDGVKVILDGPLLSGLTKADGSLVPIRGTRVLTLADGRRSYACRDCDFVGVMTMVDKDETPVIGTRGEVRKHRIDKHGVTRSGPPRGRRRGDGDAQEELPLGVDPAMGAITVDPAVMSLDLGELFELAEHVVQWERVFTTVTADRDTWKTRALAAERELRGIRRALGKLVPATPGEGDGE